MEYQEWWLIYEEKTPKGEQDRDREEKIGDTVKKKKPHRPSVAEMANMPPIPIGHAGSAIARCLPKRVLDFLMDRDHPGMEKTMTGGSQ